MEQDIKIYIDKLASKSPTPGGGGVSALCAGLGSALASMVCNLTIGKPKYAQFENELNELLCEAQTLYNKCLALAEEDEIAFEPLSKAYSLKSDTEDEKNYKETVMEKALLAAADVPLRSAQAAYDTILLHERLIERGSKLVISDVGVGVQIAKAALMGAFLNVKINTKMMKDRSVASKIDEKASELLKNGRIIADKVYDAVMQMLK